MKDDIAELVQTSGPWSVADDTPTVTTPFGEFTVSGVTPEMNNPDKAIYMMAVALSSTPRIMSLLVERNGQLKALQRDFDELARIVTEIYGDRVPVPARLPN